MISITSLHNRSGFIIPKSLAAFQASKAIRIIVRSSYSVPNLRRLLKRSRNKGLLIRIRRPAIIVTSNLSIRRGNVSLITVARHLIDDPIGCLAAIRDTGNSRGSTDQHGPAGKGLRPSA